jgi:hypothetical protein
MVAKWREDRPDEARHLNRDRLTPGAAVVAEGELPGWDPPKNYPTSRSLVGRSPSHISVLLVLLETPTSTKERVH